MASCRFSTRVRVEFLAPLLLGAISMFGCQWADNLRGDGFANSDSTAEEDWQTELRAAREEDTAYGGVSTKAHEIERRLGVKSTE